MISVIIVLYLTSHSSERVVKFNVNVIVWLLMLMVYSRRGAEINQEDNNIHRWNPWKGIENISKASRHHRDPELKGERAVTLSNT